MNERQDEGDDAAETVSLEDRLRIRRGENLDLIPANLLRKYISYARKYVQPTYVQYYLSFDFVT